MKLRISPVFQLLLAERRFSNTWYILALSILIIPLILSIGVVPVADSPGAIASTRAQITYVEILLILFCYYGISALHVSHRQRQRGLRLVWRSMGLSDWSVFWQITLLFLLETGLVSFLGLFLCWLWGNPEPGWTLTCFQSWLCLWLASGISLPLAVGLAQRLAPGFSVLLLIIFNLGGLYAVPWLDMFRNNSQTSALWQLVSEKIWAILPQLSLADQTDRITFSWKPIPIGGFGALLAYLLVWIGIAFYLGYKLFRKDPVSASLKASE
jgi:hypothetical protein